MRTADDVAAVLLVPSVMGTPEVTPLMDELRSIGIDQLAVPAADQLRSISPSTVVTVYDQWIREIVPEVMPGGFPLVVGVDFGAAAAAKAVRDGYAERAVLLSPPTTSLRVRPEMSDLIEVDFEQLSDQVERLSGQQESFDSGMWSDEIIDVVTFAYLGDPGHLALAAVAKDALARRLPLDIADVRGEIDSVEWFDIWSPDPSITVWLTRGSSAIGERLSEFGSVAVQPWLELPWLSQPDVVAQAVAAELS